MTHSATTALLGSLIEPLEDENIRETLIDADVLMWASPVLSFGDFASARVATLGLNPSKSEFVGADDDELPSYLRRLHTLDSLGIPSWNDTNEHHLPLMLDAFDKYFTVNPYDRWFGQLDALMSGCEVSYYGEEATACHLDLVPYATYSRWSKLRTWQKRTLLGVSGNALGTILQHSPIQLLVLNGQGVVDGFASVANVKYEYGTIDIPTYPGHEEMISTCVGKTNIVCNIDIGHDVFVLGYGPNIQSSFGVSNAHRRAIRDWIGAFYQREVQ